MLSWAATTAYAAAYRPAMVRSLPIIRRCHCDKVKLVIIGQPNKGRVQQVEIMDQDVLTIWSGKLGTPFSKMYSKKFDAYKLATDEDAGRMACIAEQNKYITYIFSDKWAGSQEIIPPDDTLKNWAISKIIWHANPQV